MATRFRSKHCEHGMDVSVMVIDRRQSKRVRLLRPIPFHSPDGFTWRKHGSGPADLALAILVAYVRERPPRTGWWTGEQLSR